MRKFLLMMTCLLGTSYAMQAQTVVDVNISDIQFVPQNRLADCDDAPNLYTGQKVRVRGIVLNRGGIAQTQSVGNRQLWIRDISGSGPFKTIGLRATANQPTVPDDMLSLAEGDTIEIVGSVGEFMGSQDAETQINISPDAPDRVQIIGAFDPTVPGQHVPYALQINAGDIQDDGRRNILPTGEQYEGEFVKLRNVTVAAVDQFTSGGQSRVSFWVRDQAGNQVNITDRFAIQRPINGFQAPSVGDFFDSICGIIIHNRNGCVGSPANNRGYQISPFAAEHYGRGNSAPNITGITRNPVCPRPSEPIIIRLTAQPGFVTGGGSTTIDYIRLFWATGQGTGGYSQINFTQEAGTNNWVATIPPQPDRTFVRYYIEAANTIPRSIRIPAIDANQNPSFFLVNDGGCTIRDINFTPYTTGTGSRANGASGYVGLPVTVEGVVTSDTSSLGNIFIQQEGANAWGGLLVFRDNQTSGLRIGQKVRLSGTIVENNEMTRLDNITDVVINGTGTITPLVIPTTTLATYRMEDNESYEGMLVTLQQAAGLTVVDTNYLINPSPTNNFGEWRVGTDASDPANGTLVHTGGTGSTTFPTSSKYVSFVNSARWAPRVLTQPVTVVRNGDRFGSITGVVFQSFGDLKVQPRTNADLTGYLPAGISDLIKNPNLRVFPNPASSVLNIQLTSGEDENLSISILDMQGRVAKTQTGSSTGFAVGISDLSAGIYIANITNAKGVVIGRTRVAVTR